MSSVMIGPAHHWQSFIPRVHDVETPDHFRFTLIGITASGASDTIATDVQTNIDLSTVSAAEFPYLKVVFDTSDDIDLTAVQLSQWLVLYEPTAEGVAFYRGTKMLNTVYEGQGFTGDYGFVNISDKFFTDSLSVRYDLINKNAPAPAAFAMKIAAPAPGDTILFSVPFKTVSRVGVNDAEVFVNPRTHPENDYDNNVILLQDHVNVVADAFDPVLDVTFNGRHIVSDELVSSNPDILIRLWDDSPYMRKTDTLDMKVFIAYPCDEEPCNFHPVFFTRTDVSWTAASDATDFMIRFKPTELQTGRYVLRIEGRDGSGNAAGADAFEVAFRVENDQPLSIRAPYPNPFTHYIQFEVTIAGNDTSNYTWSLDIVDVNGSSIGRFSGKDGDLKPGKNSILWNGKAYDGRFLPDGIYFYRLVVTGSEGSIESRGKVIQRNW